MDRALDEIVSERQRSHRDGGGRNRRRGNDRDAGRDRDRKFDRDTANLDDEWIHDKYDDEEDGSRRATGRSRPGRYTRASPEPDLFGRDKDKGTKIRIENLHWDLNEKDLTELFERIGPVSRVSIDYDRSGRSTGFAYVTYADALDARDAVRQFDGANAKGQPIRLDIMPSGSNSRGARNPLDGGKAGRSLIERIDGNRNDSSRSRNRERNRSRSPDRKRAELRAAPRENIDRYVPSDRGRSYSPRRRGGERGGRRRGPEDGAARRDGRRTRGDNQGRPTAEGRPRVTTDDLDKDMDEYFKGGSGSGQAASSSTHVNGSSNAAAPAGAGALAEDDIDMIE